MKKRYIFNMALFPANFVAFADANIVETLKNQLLEINTELESIQAKADAEERQLDDGETVRITELFSLFDETNTDIQRRERIEANAAALGKPAAPKAAPQPPTPAAAPGVPAAPGAQAPRASGFQVGDAGGRTWGFYSLGDFAAAVKVAAAPGGTGSVDPRLIQNAPTTYSSEGVGSDGGFAVPPDFRDTIKQKVMGETSLLGMTDQMLTSSNSMTYPKDETTPWQSSGGIQSFWEGEGKQLNQSKIQLESELLRLNKLTTLVPVTEELLEDSPALNSYLSRKAPQKMDFKITDAIINGTGVGMPTGLLNSPALISVAKEGSQVADTIVFNNIIKMWSRMYGPSRPTSVWLINQDIEPQLFTMSFEGTSSSVPAYMPANGLSTSPFSTLMGRPVIPTQSCQTLGDKGDIILADLNEYVTAMKAAGIRSDVSIHLWFDYDIVAFRFILRVTGQPWWSAAVAPKNGSNTLSPFVTLAERA